MKIEELDATEGTSRYKSLMLQKNIKIHRAPSTKLNRGSHTGIIGKSYGFYGKVFLFCRAFVWIFHYMGVGRVW